MLTLIYTTNSIIKNAIKNIHTKFEVMRLEEKENELKREYNKLHERYTEVNTIE